MATLLQPDVRQAAVHVGYYGPITVSAPNGTLTFQIDGGPMVTSISVKPEQDTVQAMAVPSDSELCEPQGNATWKDLFTELLANACCESGIAIHHISKEEHDTAVDFLVDCGLLDKRIEYPASLYTENWN
jgi:hypothetical protein